MSIYFNTMPEFTAHLDNLGLFRMSPGIGRIAVTLESMALKRSSMPLVQVVGTNGKGSTCTFLASLAKEHGVTCGLHSSPHFVSVRERVRIFRPNGPDDGEMLPEAAWLSAANTVMQHGGAELTYFELITAMAVVMLHEAGVELAVMESGLGGTFDATTALDADLVVFTPIALDHCGVLGNTLQEIARDKAGAIRAGKPVISAPQEAAAEQELNLAAKEKDTAVRFVSNGAALPPAFANGTARLGLHGAHQFGNANLALNAWLTLCALNNWQCNEATVTAALQKAWLPGRMQFAPARPELGLPALILDGGHNRHGLAALGLSLAKQGIGPGAVVFTCLADKEPELLLPHLRTLSTGPIFVPELNQHPRASSANSLAGLIGLAATPAGSVAEAVNLAVKSIAARLPEELTRRTLTKDAHPLLICGSLYLLGEFYELYPQYLVKETA